MIIYEKLWLECQPEGWRLLMALKVRKGITGRPILTEVSGIGRVRFDFLAIVLGEAIFQASLQCSEHSEGQPLPPLERLVWSPLLEGS